MRKRILISGGGTGGHIFPALAIAKELEKRYDHLDLLFVGASDRMEMEKIPAAGYKVIGLWIAGFQLSLSIRNVLFPVKLILSILKSFFIVIRFKPNVVIGTGGYASGPILWVASILKIPTLIQEQNSYPGVTNRILASRVSKICVAYSGLERFFPPKKIELFGNPIRSEIEFGIYNKKDSLAAYGFTQAKPTVLIVGGSLGAKRINEAVLAHCSWFLENDVQLIWQTGALYFEKCNEAKKILGSRAQITRFISDMSQAYSAADIVVSRAGALAISELTSIGKTCVLIPSPNVAEDHQLKNALTLANQNAAVLVEENTIDTQLFSVLKTLKDNPDKQLELSTNAKKMGQPNAVLKIVDCIDQLLL
jgi:UDP-N-acetylglucosamine--N-acetylmuramyl-(pentapeptide) pyrophosphoryl-undecaprenol N-acetylglucosamine transferase